MESHRTNNGASQPPSTVQNPKCEICGQDFDVSKNLVVTTCKPCRRFLRKFEKTQLGDTCPFDGECEVALENRSDCGPCRYSKYLKIRMERESTTTPSAVNRAVTFSSLNRFHQQQMPPAVDLAQENEESCKLCEQAPQGRKFKVMYGLLMCGRCRVLVAHNVKKQVDDSLNVCLRDDGVCSDYPSLTSCSVCLFEKYKDLVTKEPKTKKSRAVSFRIATCPQNYTSTVHQGFVPAASGVNQPPSETVIPPPIDSTVSTSSSAPVLQNSMAPEQCEICGDTVTILGNYGVVACGACVDFYARKLTSRHHQECKNSKKCKITVKNRNSCPTCRFEKCKSLGMVDKKFVGTVGNKNQTYEVAPDNSLELEKQPPTSSSENWNGTLVSDPIPVPQRKRPAETMLQDYSSQLAPNEPMEMCKLCKRVPEQYPHQLFQGIRMCQGCTDLIKHRNPVQIKCQKGNGECRIYSWVVECSSCILKEYDELMEMHAARFHENNSKVSIIADKGFQVKKARRQVPSQQDQEDHLHDRFDDSNGHYSQQMAGSSNEGYPSVPVNINLEHHNQNDGYSTGVVDPGTSHYNYINSNPIDMDIGQGEIPGDTFTMNDRDIFGEQTNQNTSQDLQLFDDDDYSEQMGSHQDQGYPGISENINQDNQDPSHNEEQSLNLQLDGLISPSKTYLSTSENMEYQNQYQDEYSNPQTGMDAPGMSHYHTGNSNLSEVDDMTDRDINSLGLHPEQGYPGTSDNINLEYQNHSQNQNQDYEYSNPQFEKVAPELGHYHSGNPEIIEIDNGQNAISEVDSSAVNTFTMNDGGNNSLGYREKSKKPRMQLPCHLNQVDQNASHTLQFFDDNNDHYSEQMGTQADQGYPGINREHQNHTQKHHPSMGEDSDSEIIVIGEKVTTQVNSIAVSRIPMSGTGYVKRSRMQPHPDKTVFVQRNLCTSIGRQHSRMDETNRTDKRIPVRLSENAVTLSNPNLRAHNTSRVWQKANNIPTKTSTAPPVLAKISARAVAPGPATVFQQQDTNIMRNDTFRHRQRPNVQYKMYSHQNMSTQPTARTLVDQSYSVEQYRNTMSSKNASNSFVMDDRDMLNQPSTSQVLPQTDRMHQYCQRNLHPSGSLSQQSYGNVAQNGVPIKHDVLEFYDARDSHHYPQQVQGPTERHQTPLADFVDDLSPLTSSNLGNRPGDSDQDGEINNTQTYQVDPEMYQDQPRSLAPEEEQIQVDGGMMHDNPNEPNDAPQQVNDDDEDDEFRIGTHEDDFDPDEFEGLLNDIPDEFN